MTFNLSAIAIGDLFPGRVSAAELNKQLSRRHNKQLYKRQCR